MTHFAGFRPSLAFHTNILTIFPGFQPWSLPKLARWAVEQGFAGLEVGPAVPLKPADFAEARRIGAQIFCLTYGRNVLAGDPDERALHQHNVLERLRFARRRRHPARRAGNRARARQESARQLAGRGGVVL
ncbi:MAG: hypothetical protein IPM07_15885 [Anaerolineales bacterium]|nr:hypothetical protein [Anaerolineales bacterium]